MINALVVVSALLAIGGVVYSYVRHFYYDLNFVISNDPAVWGQLGDYMGGILNPLLSFISIVLLIKSLTLQNQANIELKGEIENTRRTEKIRSFEAQLFNMIDSQRQAFDSLKIHFKQGKKTQTKLSVEAVVAIEDAIEKLRGAMKTDSDIELFLEVTDSFDQLYRVTRTFYVMVKMITEKLSDSEGFSKRDRVSHFLTLINFTDFALLRLILINMQFSNYPSTNYLKNNQEFNEVLNEVGLQCGLY